MRGVEEFCEQYEREQRCGEETGPRLLEDEEKELPEDGLARAGGDVGFETEAGVVEAGFGGG